MDGWGFGSGDEGDGGGGCLQFWELVDCRAEFFLDVADASIFVRWVVLYSVLLDRIIYGRDVQ